MIATTPEEIQKLREIGRIVARCLQMMKEAAKPGMSLLELDALAGEFLKAHGARSAPQVTYDFPGVTCLSIAPVVAHGIPNEQILKDGDLLNVDVSAEKDGFFGDTGGSFYVGTPDPEGERLLKATAEALQEAMKAAKAGAKLNKIGQRIESVADRYRFTIIENLGSHGVGKSLHEEPKFIAGFYDPDDKRVLKKGQVITIEPFLATKSCFVDEMPDGWSLIADEGGISAQFEHTLVITDGAPLVMTDPN
ncbi:MAG: type I methionyl aminopeptidase [Bdellovibrionaceae bacterium]|nr:type I methionyl aminopeptidase [Pseudobdellovibrionaceae bacterium]